MAIEYSSAAPKCELLSSTANYTVVPGVTCEVVSEVWLKLCRPVLPINGDDNGIVIGVKLSDYSFISDGLWDLIVETFIEL